MQSENPFSTYHLWNFNQNKGPKHYSDFMEAQQRREQQMNARSDKIWEQQLINVPALKGRFTDVRPESPAMAQARKPRSYKIADWDARTGRKLSTTELDNFKQQREALYNQQGWDIPDFKF